MDEPRPVRKHYCYMSEYRYKLQKRIIKLVTDGSTLDMLVTILRQEGFKRPSMQESIQLKDIKNQVRQIRTNGGKAKMTSRDKVNLGYIPALTTTARKAEQQALDLPEPAARSKVLVDPCIAQILLGSLTSTQKVEMLIGFHGLTAQYESISKAL